MTDIFIIMADMLCNVCLEVHPLSDIKWNETGSSAFNVWIASLFHGSHVLLFTSIWKQFYWVQKEDIP